MVYLYVYTLHAGAHYWTDVSFKKKKNNTRSVVCFIFFAKEKPSLPSLSCEYTPTEDGAIGQFTALHI